MKKSTYVFTCFAHIGVLPLTIAAFATKQKEN